ncbi:MAG: acetyl-CoA acetyltransferase, partial [Methyloversatilis sp. 12-65-5]
MTRQIQDAYIVAAKRTAVARKNGAFRHVRPDDMLAHVLRGTVAAVPAFDLNDIGDVVVGCAMPEAEQGMNVARIGVL